MRIHELEIDERGAREVLLGKRTFEVRRDDRSIHEGDLITFTLVEGPEARGERCAPEASDKPVGRPCLCRGYQVPAEGEAVCCCHDREADPFDAVPGESVKMALSAGFWRVGYVLRGSRGLTDGYCAFSINGAEPGEASRA